jgi:hypothetical protein
MNNFQEKLMRAISGHSDIDRIGPKTAILAINPEELWYDADDVDFPKVDPKAIKRVANPLPVPAMCPHCAGRIRLMSNAVIYNGKEYGKWPYTYICQKAGCRAYVGCHPNTFIPLGTLATAPMRDARKKAKAAFNPLWESGQMTRSQAYTWLATQLGIKNKEECHIGWFDVEQCRRVVQVCNQHMAEEQ